MTMIRYDLCDDIEVIDVPGNHFSILRQDEEDMQLVTLSLKFILGDAGWTQAVPVGSGVFGYGDKALELYRLIEEEEEDLAAAYDKQLEALGCIDPNMKTHMHNTLIPIVDTHFDGNIAFIIKRPGIFPYNAAAISLMLLDPTQDRIVSQLPSYKSDEEDQWQPWADLSEEPKRDDGINHEPEYLLPGGTHHPAPRTLGRNGSRGASGSSPLHPLEVLEPWPQGENEKIVRSNNPVLIFCCDANGSVGGLDSILKNLHFPVFVCTLPLTTYLWEVETMQDLGAMVARSVLGEIRTSWPDAQLLFGGTGFGGEVAFEAALNLYKKTKSAVSILLFDGIHSIKDQHRSLFWMNHLSKSEVDEWAQTATQLYTLVQGDRIEGKHTLSLTGFAAKLHQMPFNQALDWLEKFKPKGLDIVDWDNMVHSILVRLEYFRSLSRSYAPEYRVPGGVVLFSNMWEDGLPDSLSHGGNSGVWRNICACTLPVQVCYLPTESSDAQVTNWLASQMIEAVVDRLLDEKRVPGGIPPSNSILVEGEEESYATRNNSQRTKKDI